MADSILSGAAEFFSRGLDRGIRQKEVATQNKIEQAREAQQKQYQDAMLQQGAARLAQETKQASDDLEFKKAKEKTDDIAKMFALTEKTRHDKQLEELRNTSLETSMKRQKAQGKRFDVDEFARLFKLNFDVTGSPQQAEAYAKQGTSSSDGSPMDAPVGIDGSPTPQKVMGLAMPSAAAKGSPADLKAQKDGVLIAAGKINEALKQSQAKATDARTKFTEASTKIMKDMEGYKIRGFNDAHQKAQDIHELQGDIKAKYHAEINHLNALTKDASTVSVPIMQMSEEQIQNKMRTNKGKADVIKDLNLLEQPLKEIKKEIEEKEKEGRHIFDQINSHTFRMSASAIDTRFQALQNDPKHGSQWSAGTEFTPARVKQDYDELHGQLEIAKQSLQSINAQVQEMYKKKEELEPAHDKIYKALTGVTLARPKDKPADKPYEGDGKHALKFPKKQAVSSAAQALIDKYKKK